MMKFEYSKKDDVRECVAYIDNWGIVIKDNEGAVCIFDDGSGVERDAGWNPKDAKHRFYPGDSITITF